MDAIFKALADRTRRTLLDRLNKNNGQTLNELCLNMDMSRQAITRHLNVLEAGNLIITVWKGRDKYHYLNPIPLQQIYDRWISGFTKDHIKILMKIKEKLETNKI